MTESSRLNPAQAGDPLLLKDVLNPDAETIEEELADVGFAKAPDGKNIRELRLLSFSC